MAIFTKVSTKIENLLFDHKGDVFLIPVTFLLICLSLTVLISFLGCFGSCLGSRCLMGLVWNLIDWNRTLKIFLSISLFCWCCFSAVWGLQCQSWCLMLRKLEVRRERPSQGIFPFLPAGTILGGTIPLYNDSADIQAFWDTIQHRQVYLLQTFLLTDVNKASNLD